MVKCFPWSPFSQCIIFSDKIFGIQYLISFTFIIYLGTNECHQTRQATDKGTSRPAEIFWGPVEWLWERGASNIWMHSRKVNKYLYFSNLNFTMKGASVKKVILRFSSGNDPICHSQKFQPSQTPPSHFLPISPRFLTNIRCQYFSLNIWVVYDQLELDWCIFDQNWAKTRPLHFQIFQILNAIDRPIVQWFTMLSSTFK